MKNRNVSICLILALVLVLGLCPVTGASADDTYQAVVDTSSSYTPTSIVNGGFEDAKGATSNGARLGVDEGWTTTDNWLERSNSCSTYGVKAPTSGQYFVEMNGNQPGTLYQDLTTHGGDVIRWTLDHAARNAGGNPQTMEVQIGAPDGNDPVGTGSNIQTHIEASTKAVYSSTGVTNPEGKEYGFGNTNELANLSVPQLSSNNPWYNAKGIYLVPDGQSVTRFAFVSTCSSPGLGNELDNITFSTLIGNLSATYTDGKVVIGGYWGDTDTSKKLIVKIGDTTYSVDMSGVTGENFTVTIPTDSLTGDTVEVYHQDYESAKRTVKFDHTVTLVQYDPTTPGTPSVKVAKDEMMPDVTVPQKDNCTFHGYFSGENGTGDPYYDADGKGIKAWDKDEDGTLYAYWTHEHAWAYKASGDTLYAWCSNTEYADQCDYQEGHELTLTILVDSKQYDGQPVEATLAGTESWEEVFEEVPEIEFYTRDQTTGHFTNFLLTTAFAEERLEEAPSEIGKYTAKITYEGQTATKDFEIYAPAAPKTGDNTLVGLLLLLLTASSLSVILLVKKSRKTR